MKISERAYLLIIIICGALLRLDFLYASNFIIDSDEAIVGLMAKHALEGQQMPPFYYGQHYMGSLEPYVASLIFLVTGPTLLGLKLVPLIFSLYLIYLVYLIGVALGQQRYGRLAALFCALPPATLIIWSMKARGGFIELLCLGALALLWTLRWMREERFRALPLLLVGFLLGVGWWINNQILYFMLPIGFVILSRVRSIRDLILGGAAGFGSFLVGSAPFWIYNLRHSFISFQQLGSSSGGDVFSHLLGYFFTALPILVGAGRYWGDIESFPGSHILFGLILIPLFVFIIFLRGRRLWDLFLFRTDSQSGVELLLLFLFALTSVFTMSSFGYLAQAPRYLLPFYVAYFPLLAYAICGLENIFSGKIGRVAVWAILFLHLCSAYYAHRALPGEPFVYQGERVSKDHTDLLTWLEEKKINYVKTNYWIGYRLAYESREKVTFSVFREPETVRIPSYEQPNAALERTIPYILVPSQAKIVRRALDISGFTYEIEKLSGYSVLYNILPPVRPPRLVHIENVELSASQSPDELALALDGNLKTRWASHAPQKKGMFFEVTLKEPRNVRYIEYKLGRWYHDYPRRLKMQLEFTDGEIEVIGGRKLMESLRYVSELMPYKFALSGKPLKKLTFMQMGGDTLFDWSIAELELSY